MSDIRLNRRVLIGTPALTGTVDVRYAFSLTETVRLGLRYGVDIQVRFIAGESMLQRARNDLVKFAIEQEATDLIFIDSDQGWEPEWVIRLLQYPVDCVGGAVVKKDDDAEVYNVRATTVPIPRDPETGLLVVDAVGTGFIRLSRRALLALWNGSPEYVDDYGKRSRWIFNIGPVNGRLVGEDTLMCMKLADAGIVTHVDPTMTCTHVGPKVYRGDFAKWLAGIEASHG
jgi:hypothetical protein